ncbi:hypothetical protein SAMN06265222_102126 [Neorhodopirellula lusitana]|uniref:Uncharacterized protein n=1 Tax=Neorhodopirellula lusitana TaxID=445327 RepID=A0ABY1PXL0_9BACT|nr:hypothetical protein SAMN06265222_102126 [Neorhodopirellula lusitana]
MERFRISTDNSDADSTQRITSVLSAKYRLRILMTVLEVDLAAIPYLKRAPPIRLNKPRKALAMQSLQLPWSTQAAGY